MHEPSWRHPARRAAALSAESTRAPATLETTSPRVRARDEEAARILAAATAAVHRGLAACEAPVQARPLDAGVADVDEQHRHIRPASP